MNNFKVGEEGDKTSDTLWTLQELQGTAINLVGENVTSQHNGLLRTVQAGQDTDFLGLAERQLTVKNTGDREQQQSYLMIQETLVVINNLKVGSGDLWRVNQKHKEQFQRFGRFRLDRYQEISQDSEL